jgi:hypothetical protein
MMWRRLISAKLNLRGKNEYTVLNKNFEKFTVNIYPMKPTNESKKSILLQNKIVSQLSVNNIEFGQFKEI